MNNEIRVHRNEEDEDLELRFNRKLECSNCEKLGSWVDKNEQSNPLGLCNKCLKEEEERGILKVYGEIPIVSRTDQRNYFRRATLDELKALAEYHYGPVWREEGISDSDLKETCAVVFPNYISDGPGYYGKILVVIWGGGPSYHEVFTWDKVKEEWVKEESEWGK